MKQLLLTTLAVCFLSNVGFAKNAFYPTKFNKSLKQPKFSDVVRDDKLYYYGGPVIASPRVVAVYWTGAVDSQVQKEMGGFYAATVNSTHMDWISEQYSTFTVAKDGRPGTQQKITRGSFGGDFVISPKNTSKSIDDKDIQSEIENQIANHVLPAPDSNTLYMIHFPPGLRISIDGMKSCQTFCAYHMGFESKTYGPIYYGVMPDFTKGMCAMGCGPANAFDRATIVSSHELFEAITDAMPTAGDQPAFPQAWNTTYGAEVGDNCNAGDAIVRTPTKTYKVQAEWDNVALTCRGGDYTSP